MINSIRRYKIVGYLPVAASEYESFSVEDALEDILYGECEYQHVLQEDIDELLDMKVGDRIQKLTDRSDEYSSMTVTRIW